MIYYLRRVRGNSWIIIVQEFTSPIFHQFLLIFKKARDGELSSDSGLLTLARMTSIDVSTAGVSGAKNFFEAKAKVLTDSNLARRASNVSNSGSTDSKPREKGKLQDWPRVQEKEKEDARPKVEKPEDEKPADEKPKDEEPKDENPKDEKLKDEKPEDEKPEVQPVITETDEVVVEEAAEEKPAE